MLDLLKFSITAKNNTGNAFGNVKKELTGMKGMMASVNDQAKRMGRNMRNVGAGMSAGVTAPLVMMGKSMVTAYDTQLKAENAVAGAIKSTGGAAGKTLSQLKGLASGLQDVSTYGDEDILRNVTAPLLTFTKIQGDVFDRAQASTLDYATLLKMDLKSATLQVGKALNDPIKGVAALGKAGVQFEDSQKGMIKSLMETGDVAGAQNIILKELEKQFVGQAKLAAETPLGQWDQLVGKIGDVKEQLGEQIVPFLKPVFESLEKGISWFSALSPEVKKNIVVFGGLAAAVGPVVGVMGLAVLGVTTVTGAVATLTGVLLANPIGIALGAIAGGAYLIYRNWEGISSWFSNLWGGRVKSAFVSGWELIKAVMVNYSAPGIIYRNWTGITEFFGGIWDGIKADASVAWSGISKVVSGFTFESTMGPGWAGVDAFFSSLWVSVSQTFSVGWAGIKNVLVNYTAEQLVYSAWRGIGAWFSNLTGEVVLAFRQIWEGVKAEVATWPAAMVQVGKDVVDGLIAGVKAAPGKLVEAAKDLGRSLIWGTKGELDSNSPSKVFMGIGKDVVDGLAIGISDNAMTAVSAMAGVTDSLKKETAKAGGLMTSFRDGAKSIFKNVLTGAQSFKGALSSVLGGWGNQLLDNGLNGLFGAIFPFADGGVLGKGKVIPYASGGVVDRPTMFGMAGNQTGLMGEAGPEAILPLSRGSDGKLGVRAGGNGGGGGTQVTLNFAPVIDARGVDASVVERMQEQMEGLAKSFEPMVHKTLKSGSNRRLNRAWQT